MNRLETIATRQRRSRARDVVFASFIALLVLLGGTTIGVTAGTAGATITGAGTVAGVIAIATIADTLRLPDRPGIAGPFIS